MLIKNYIDDIHELLKNNFNQLYKYKMPLEKLLCLR